MYIVECSDEIKIYLSHIPKSYLNQCINGCKPKYPLICENQPYLLIKTKEKTYRIDIPPHYEYDGATIFRFLWRTIGHPLLPQFQNGAVFHDYMCENKSVIDYDRQLSSKVFYHLLRFSGVNRVLAKIMYCFVDFWQRFCDWSGKC